MGAGACSTRSTSTTWSTPRPPRDRARRVRHVHRDRRRRGYVHGLLPPDRRSRGRRIHPHLARRPDASRLHRAAGLGASALVGRDLTGLTERRRLAWHKRDRTPTSIERGEARGSATGLPSRSTKECDESRGCGSSVSRPSRATEASPSLRDALSQCGAIWSTGVFRTSWTSPRPGGPAREGIVLDRPPYRAARLERLLAPAPRETIRVRRAS